VFPGCDNCVLGALDLGIHERCERVGNRRGGKCQGHAIGRLAVAALASGLLITVGMPGILSGSGAV
jgi:hypothetical protein